MASLRRLPPAVRAGCWRFIRKGHICNRTKLWDQSWQVNKDAMSKVGINHTVVQSGIYFFNAFLFSEHRTRPSNRQDCILFGLGTSSPRKANKKIECHDRAVANDTWWNMYQYLRKSVKEGTGKRTKVLKCHDTSPTLQYLSFWLDPKSNLPWRMPSPQIQCQTLKRMGDKQWYVCVYICNVIDRWMLFFNLPLLTPSLHQFCDNSLNCDNTLGCPPLRSQWTDSI